MNAHVFCTRGAAIRRIWSALAAAWATAGLVACTPGMPGAASPGNDAGAPAAPGVCAGAPWPGPPMLGGTLEAQAGYEALRDALPGAPLDAPVSVSDVPPFEQAVLAYMLGTPPGADIHEADLIAAGPLGDAVRAALETAAATPERGQPIDFSMLRRGLHHAYQCARPLPHTFDAFKSAYGDPHTWPSRRTDCSQAKGGTRLFYDHPDGRATVAQTVEDTPDGPVVREIEVLLHDTRPGGSFDFAVYTEHGALTDRSTFATHTTPITLGAPYTCITCHFDPDTRAVTLTQPLHTGGACRD